MEVKAEDDGDGDDEMTERAFNGGDWTRDTSGEEYVEYISDRRRLIIDEWMDRCIDEMCPGWQSLRELDIWARTRRPAHNGVEDINDADYEREEDAWRMLDEVSRV